MGHEELSLDGVRGLTLHVQAWRPETTPSALVVIVHGYAEHGGRYAHLAGRLVDAGCAVYAADHRGHGRSQGKRRSLVRFSDYLDDLARVLAYARAAVPGRPVVLLGHSMGGLIGLAYVVRDARGIDALIVSAPAACPGDVSRATIAAGRVLSRVAPNAGVLKLPLHRISRDPAVVDAYMHDPLVSPGPMRARMGSEMLSAMAVVEAGLPALRLPLLVMQGSDDGLVDPTCGPHVHDRAGSPDKTLRMYPGLWHEIFNEPERDAVIDDLLAWLRERVATIAT